MNMPKKLLSIKFFAMIFALVTAILFIAFDASENPEIDIVDIVKMDDVNRLKKIDREYLKSLRFGTKKEPYDLANLAAEYSSMNCLKWIDQNIKPNLLGTGDGGLRASINGYLCNKIDEKEFVSCFIYLSNAFPDSLKKVSSNGASPIEYITGAEEFPASTFKLIIDEMHPSKYDGRYLINILCSSISAKQTNSLEKAEYLLEKFGRNEDSKGNYPESYVDKSRYGHEKLMEIILKHQKISYIHP